MKVLALALRATFHIVLATCLAFTLGPFARCGIVLATTWARASGRVMSLASAILAYLATCLILGPVRTGTPPEHMFSPATIVA